MTKVVIMCGKKRLSVPHLSDDDITLHMERLEKEQKSIYMKNKVFLNKQDKYILVKIERDLMKLRIEKASRSGVSDPDILDMERAIGYNEDIHQDLKVIHEKCVKLLNEGHTLAESMEMLKDEIGKVTHKDERNISK
ncbi:MAG: hypothetical protein ACRC92_26485 [Peptostreptococcaceae bacterium]